MANKTSDELKAEPTNLFFGINASTLLVESVVVTRGGTLTLQREQKAPSVYRIRGGRPAHGEIQRVFGLTNLIAMAPSSDPAQLLTHPLLIELKQMAERMRVHRDAAGKPDA